MASSLTVKINDVAVDCVSVKLNFRTINQGHMMFILTLDNYEGQYNGVFDANDAVEVYFNEVLIFKGILDSAKHTVSQEQKWNFMNYLRVSGRDLSIELSNLKYTYAFPSTWQFDDMIKKAFDDTGCTITFTISDTLTIGGHVSEDQYLFDLVREVMQKASYEGYVDLAKALQYFPVGDATKTTGVSIDDSNCLGAEYTEIEGRDIRNAIDVIGKGDLKLPVEEDDWTEPLTNWTSDGTLALRADKQELGLYSIQGSKEPAQNVNLIYTPTSTIDLRKMWSHRKLNFYLLWEAGADIDLVRIELRAPNAANCFRRTIYKDDLGPEGVFKHFSLNLGVTSEDEWLVVGSPDWANVQAIYFYLTLVGSANLYLCVDGLQFTEKKYHGSASDGTSQENYTKRELTKYTDALSDADAEAEATKLLAEMKDPLVSMRVTTPASTFIVDSVWKGLVGHRITFYGVTYRIIDLTVDITPYQNLKDGFDAIASFNCVPVTAKLEPDTYASIMNPKATSILRRFKQKAEP